jgi:hypothetical protein
MTADLVLAADPGVVERAADPAAFVVAACERAKAWLKQALEHSGVEQIAEIKSQAEAVRVYTAQKQLGKDAQLAAAEIVRRAERGIGLAIRRGQQNRQIRRRGDRCGRADGNGDDNTVFPSKTGPADYASPGELRGNGAGIYHMTDDVSEEDFEEALATAKTEGDLSRANVVRKIRRRRGHPPARGGQVPDPADRSPEAAAGRRELIGAFATSGMSSAQIGERLGIGEDRVRQLAREQGVSIRADAVLGRTRQPASARIVRETVHALEGLAMSVQLADPAGLDPAQAAACAASLSKSIRVLSKFVRQLKEVSTT